METQAKTLILLILHDMLYFGTSKFTLNIRTLYLHFKTRAAMLYRIYKLEPEISFVFFLLIIMNKFTTKYLNKAAIPTIKVSNFQTLFGYNKAKN